MSAVLRAKMRVEQVTRVIGADGQPAQEQVKLRAVYGEGNSENAKWAKYTPAANFDIYINNPEAFGQLSSGFEYYVDFIPVEK